MSRGNQTIVIKDKFVPRGSLQTSQGAHTFVSQGKLITATESVHELKY